MTKINICRTATAALCALAPMLGGAAAFAGSAAEPIVEAAPVIIAPVFQSAWAGGYVGAQVGYGWADNSVKDNNSVADNLRGIGQDGDGWLGGAYAGYLWNSNRFVFGGEGSYDFADIQFKNNTGKIDGLGRLKVIGGYDFGQTLLYATAGAAYGNGSITGKSHADWGWLAGAGLDYMINDAWSVGAEALYQDFGKFGSSNTNVTLTTLEARFTYHF